MVAIVLSFLGVGLLVSVILLVGISYREYIEKQFDEDDTDDIEDGDI